MTKQQYFITICLALCVSQAIGCSAQSQWHKDMQSLIQSLRADDVDMRRTATYELLAKNPPDDKTPFGSLARQLSSRPLYGDSYVTMTMEGIWASYMIAIGDYSSGYQSDWINEHGLGGSGVWLYLESTRFLVPYRGTAGWTHYIFVIKGGCLLFGTSIGHDPDKSVNKDWFSHSD